MFLRRHPECADCGREATEAHHIVPRAQGGSDRWENLMPLCKACHSARTRRG
jgi:5-methylcytosine-specific restriction endonuclease McrA